MESIAVYNSQEIAPSEELTASLFNDFVSFIDRSANTSRAYIINLRQFAAWLKYTNCSRPQRKDIILYRDYLTAEHDAIQLAPGTPAGFTYRTDNAGNHIKIKCKPNTVAQYLRSVCQFFKWTAANGLYPDIAANIHAPKIKHDTHKKDALSAQDVITIENAISAGAVTRTEAASQAAKDTAGRVQRSTEQGKRLYAMYLLAVNAGLRTIEISRANIKDLETKGGQSWLYVWGKGHSEPDQKKAIAPEVKAAIDDYLQSRSDKPTGNSPLFVSTGNRSKGQRIAPTTISTMLKRAMQEAGYDSERITAHSLRHTAGTAAMEITGNIYQTQQYMRHSNPSTTEIYLHNETEKQDAELAQQLYNFYHGKATSEPAEINSQIDLERIAAAMTTAQLAQLLSLVGAATK